jgi:hypothetical protein
MSIDDVISADLEAARADFARQLRECDEWMLRHAREFNRRYRVEHPWRARWHDFLYWLKP